MIVSFREALSESVEELKYKGDARTLKEIYEIADKIRGFDERIGVYEVDMDYDDNDEVVQVYITFKPDEKFQDDIPPVKTAKKVCKILGIKAIEYCEDLDCPAAKYSEMITIYFY